jgi:hypothetical protein
MKRMKGGTKRQCDRTLQVERLHAREKAQDGAGCV